MTMSTLFISVSWAMLVVVVGASVASEHAPPAVAPASPASVDMSPQVPDAGASPPASTLRPAPLVALSPAMPTKPSAPPPPARARAIAVPMRAWVARHVEQGRKLRDERQAEAAAYEFAVAYAFEPQPGILIEVARACSKAALDDEALALFQRLQADPQASYRTESEEAIKVLHVKLDDLELGTTLIMRNRIERAKQLFLSGNFVQAAREYGLAYTIHPLPRLLFNAAQAYRRASQATAAYRLFTRFLETEPSTPLKRETQSYLDELQGATFPPPVYKRTWFWASLTSIVLTGIAVGVDGTLTLNANGFAKDGCLIAQGTATATVGPLTQAELGLLVGLLPQSSCRIDANLMGPGGGILTSNPPGIKCDATICSAGFPPGTEVSLHCTPTEANTVCHGWSDTCQNFPLPTDDCLVTTTTTPTKLTANILPLVDWTAVAGSSGENIWAVGKKGSIIRGNGTSWSWLPSHTPNDLFAIGVTSAKDADAVGQAGTILHWDGAIWSDVSFGSSSLYGVWEFSLRKWVVGDSGTILLGDGVAWSTVPSGTTKSLRSIWGSGLNDVWCVGDGGTLLHYDGSTWQSVASNTMADLKSVWGSGPKDIWAAGTSGTTLHYDGVSWTARSPNTAKNLNAIWGSSANDVWLAGQDNAVFHYDGHGWSSKSFSFAVPTINSLWGSSDLVGSRVWLFGIMGTLVIYEDGVGQIG